MELIRKPPPYTNVKRWKTPELAEKEIGSPGDEDYLKMEKITDIDEMKSLISSTSDNINVVSLASFLTNTNPAPIVTAGYIKDNSGVSNVSYSNFPNEFRNNVTPLTHRQLNKSPASIVGWRITTNKEIAILLTYSEIDATGFYINMHTNDYYNKKPTWYGSHFYVPVAVTGNLSISPINVTGFAPVKSYYPEKSTPYDPEWEFPLDRYLRDTQVDFGFRSLPAQPRPLYPLWGNLIDAPNGLPYTTILGKFVDNKSYGSGSLKVRGNANPADDFDRVFYYVANSFGYPFVFVDNLSGFGNGIGVRVIGDSYTNPWPWRNRVEVTQTVSVTNAVWNGSYYNLNIISSVPTVIKLGEYEIFAEYPTYNNNKSILHQLTYTPYGIKGYKDDYRILTGCMFLKLGRQTSGTHPTAEETTRVVDTTTLTISGSWTDSATTTYSGGGPRNGTYTVTSEYRVNASVPITFGASYYTNQSEYFEQPTEPILLNTAQPFQLRSGSGFVI